MLNKLLESITTKRAIIIIIILGFVVFLNGLFGEFVGDDIAQIVNNTYVHSLKNIGSFFTNPTIAGKLFDRFYRPLMFTSFASLYTLFGQNTIPYHFFQLCLHISDAILVFLLFRKFFDKKISLFLSLIFLVHPINSEVVDYIADLQEVLLLLFGLSAVHVLDSKKITELKKYIIITFLLIMSFLSKETAILFLPMVVLFSYFYKKQEIKLAIITTLTSLSFYAFLRIFVAKINFVHSSAPVDLLIQTTLLTIPKMIYFYISTFFFPKVLALRTAWLVSTPTFADFYFPLTVDLIFLLFVVSLGIFIFKKAKTDFTKYVFFLAWFVIGISPALQLWLLEVTVAERWFYFPIIGLLGLLGVLFSNIKIKNQKVLNLLIILAILILVCLGARTVVRNSNWYSRMSLYSHDFAISRDVSTGNFLMQEYFYAGKYKEAAELLPVLESLRPNTLINLSYRAVLETLEGDFESAEFYFRGLLGSNFSGITYQYLPKIVADKGDLKEAEKLLVEGVKLYPNDPVLWRNLAYVKYKLGKINEATKAAQKINMTIEQIIGN